MPPSPDAVALPREKRVCDHDLTEEELTELLLLAALDIMRLQCELSRVRAMLSVGTNNEITKINVENEYFQRLALRETKRQESWKRFHENRSKPL